MRIAHGLTLLTLKDIRPTVRLPIGGLWLGSDPDIRHPVANCS